MAKEGDAAIPKKRKPEAASTSNGGNEVKQPKITVEEKKPNSAGIYQRVAAFEEKEALTRDSIVDLNQYKILCKEFSDHISRISDLMTTKPEGWAQEVKERRMEVGLLTVYMKKLNRVEKIRNKNSRENVTKKRQQVDVSQLQLQNLMCEIQHLSREVDKCLCFKSKPLGVDLVPVEEFFEEAPENISRPETTKSDDHQLLLARLEWELFQRKELSILCSKLDEKKKSLSTQISKKQSDFDGLAPLIREVLTVTKPLQEKLGFVAAASPLKSDKSSFLPHCLYYLYTQTTAYKEASGENIVIEINGNEDLAREVMKQRVHQGDKESSSGEESDCVEIDSTTRKEVASRLLKKRERLLEKHPLTVTIKWTFKDDRCLTLEFAYFLKLNIMTVTPLLNLSNPQMRASEAGSSLLNRNLLCQLFPGDTGTTTPNVSNHFQLNEVGLENLDTQKFGFPYVWVQKIGGLDCTSASDGALQPKMDTSQANIPAVINIIRNRIRSRAVLAKQVMLLESKNVHGPPEMKSVKLSCSIKSWKTMTWEEYREHPASAHLKDTPYVSPQDIFFQAIIVRGKAKMVVLTAVKCDYPRGTPAYALQIEWNDSVLNASNSSKIIEMEREVNVYWKELAAETPSWPSNLLIFQVHRAMSMFDIFLECNDAAKFSAEKKTFLHPTMGRRRAHPYKHMKIGEGIFVQRTNCDLDKQLS